MIEVLRWISSIALILQEAVHRLSGNGSSVDGPLSDLTAPFNSSEYRHTLLEGHRAGFTGSMPTLSGEYTLQQYSSQGEVGQLTQTEPAVMHCCLHSTLPK